MPRRVAQRLRPDEPPRDARGTVRSIAQAAGTSGEGCSGAQPHAPGGPSSRRSGVGCVCAPCERRVHRLLRGEGSSCCIWSIPPPSHPDTLLRAGARFTRGGVSGRRPCRRVRTPRQGRAAGGRRQCAAGGGAFSRSPTLRRSSRWGNGKVASIKTPQAYGDAPGVRRSLVRSAPAVREAGRRMS